MTHFAKDSTFGVVSNRFNLADPAWTDGLETFVYRLFFVPWRITDENVPEIVAASGNKLKQLAIVDQGITAEGATAIANLTELHTLHLNNNSIGDEGATAIANLTELHTLHLNNNSIGDEGATAIANLTELHTLHLNNNSIGDEGVRRVLTALSEQSPSTLGVLDLQTIRESRSLSCQNSPPAPMPLRS